jgi:hypothetical protein
VVLASHDSRLIDATECDIWVCGESNNDNKKKGRDGGEKRASVAMALPIPQALTVSCCRSPGPLEGIRLENEGLIAYRKKVCREIEEEAAAAEVGSHSGTPCARARFSPIASHLCTSLFRSLLGGGETEGGSAYGAPGATEARCRGGQWEEGGREVARHLTQRPTKGKSPTSWGTPVAKARIASC